MKTLPKILIVLLLAGAVGAVVTLKSRNVEEDAAKIDSASPSMAETSAAPEAAQETTPEPSAKMLPRLVDLGADKCVPCKAMAPILGALKKEYAGKFEVEFIDVWKNPSAGEKYGIQMIPTQIFFDASGTERFRHTGFFGKEDILAKWNELGVDPGSSLEEKSTFSRWQPAQPDDRRKDSVCYLCDGDIDAKTRTVMKTSAGDVAFCCPHCYVITYASLTDENKTHEDAWVTDWSTGELVPLAAAVYVCGVDANGRPTIKAFADEAGARSEQGQSGGNIVAWPQLEEEETAVRCGFCDRPVYAEDASVVGVDGGQTWGCCVMCALGVAARLQKDIEVITKDALTGEPIRVKTVEGHVSELVPPTAVAWAGAKKDADGKIHSTGCFKQAFFTSETSLRKWAEDHPTATGHQVSIEQALAAKMSLTPQQIGKACKIGECAPK